MEYTIGTKCDPCTLKIVLDVLAPARLRLQVYDPAQAATVLADRPIKATPGQRHECYVPLPVSPWQARVRIVPESGQDQAGSFRVTELRKMGLATHLNALDWRSGEMGQAIALGNRFCYNLGVLPVLPADQAYSSPDRSLKIKFLTTLDNPDTGQESVTPMRISDQTAIMEASQRKCVPYTVAGRAVMFFHEFSHKFENRQPEDELEADLNGLTIYLALGYSRYEAIQVYQTVFNQVDNEENRQRMAHIVDFIKNFESIIKKSKK